MYGEKIKNALTTKGMTQKELAELMYVTPQAVSKWINEESRPSSDNCAELHKLLGINLLEDFVQECRREYKCSNTSNMKHPLLEELDTFEKAERESERLIAESGLGSNYSKPVIVLFKWLLPAVIGLCYHNKIHHPEEEIEYDDISYNLELYLNTDCPKHLGLYENCLEYGFYLMGGDLFESFEPYKLKNHDYCAKSMDSWYRFRDALIKNDASPIYCEFIVAICDLADYVLKIVN